MQLSEIRPLITAVTRAEQLVRPVVEIVTKAARNPDTPVRPDVHRFFRVRGELLQALGALAVAAAELHDLARESSEQSSGDQPHDSAATP